MSGQPEIAVAVDAGAELGESPVWCDRDRVLWWIDIKQKAIHRFDPATGRDRSWPAPDEPGSLALRASGGLMVAMRDGFFAFDPATGGFSRFATAPDEPATNRMNDGRADRAGRFWAGSMRDPPDPPAAPGRLYRLDPDGAVTAMADRLIVSNGLAFSPDDRTLYHSDSHASVRTIWAYDFDLAAGHISNKRIFVDTHGLAGRPDGAAVDTDGCYWMAGAGGGEIYRFTPQGRLDRRIALPVQRPSMPAFGGTDLRTLYVTTIGTAADKERQPLAGCVFAIETGAQGLPEPRFRG